MSDSTGRRFTPRLRGNRLLALLGLLAVAVSIGLFYWNTQASVPVLRLGSSVELKYRQALVEIFCQEARQHDLVIEVQSMNHSADSVDKVASGKLDLAVVPAGLSLQNDNVRQVAVLDCEALQLFVRPAMLAGGPAALRGKRLNLGAAGSGARILAGEVLTFMGMKAGADYQDAALSYAELITMPNEQMPDAIFGLSPLPSRLGERLVQDYGFALMELPFGAAMNLRKPAIEDVVVPAHTYGVHPAVPDKPLHTIGTRGVVIANSSVPAVSVRRLLEVFYESDFARRVGIPPLDETRIARASEYPNHPGTVAYIHRHDPWVNKDFIDNVTSLRGLAVSIASAVILLWQWFRRRRTSGLNDYLRECTRLEAEATRAALRGQLDEAQLAACLRQLMELRVDVLEKHHSGVFPADQSLAALLARLDALQQSLPNLPRSAAPPASLAVPAVLAERKAA